MIRKNTICHSHKTNIMTNCETELYKAVRPSIFAVLLNCSDPAEAFGAALGFAFGFALVGRICGFGGGLVRASM